MTVLGSERIRQEIVQYERSIVGILGSRSLALWLATAIETVRLWDPTFTQGTVGELPENVHWYPLPDACYGNAVTTVIVRDHPIVVASIPEIFETPERSKSIVIDFVGCIPRGPWHETHIVTVEGSLCS